MRKKPKILIVDDEKPLRDTLARWLSPSYDCITAPDAASALEIVKSTPDLSLLISDIKMPGEDGITLVRKAKEANGSIACMLLTAYGTVDLAVEAMKDGADDFFQKPVTDLSAFEMRVAKAVKTVTLEKENAELKARLNTELEDFTGRSPAMMRIYGLIRKVAPTNATVLVEGPSGTGKELVARALHNLSPRAGGPFVAVECAALSKELLESELFGYEAGAFTGANTRGRIGNIEAANGGTLFLDEIGEIDQEMQVKLLRVLESRTIRRVGGNEDIAVDFRLVAATNKNLASLVKAGKFREDLYYRLNVIDIRTPALSSHKEDIAPLVARFLKEFSAANGGSVTGIEPRALKALEDYSWPGNVRQLRNVMEKMVILASGAKLTEADLPVEITDEPPDDAAEASPTAASSSGVADGSARREGDETLAEAEKRQILAAIAAAGGNKTKAADALGISRRTLHRKINEWKAG